MVPGNQASILKFGIFNYSDLRKLGVLIERPLQNDVQVVSVLELHLSALLDWESIVIINRKTHTK